MKAINNTLRRWLLENHYEDVAEQIEFLLQKWKATGTHTRRNWWDVLAGNKKGEPAVIGGITFPVLRAARLRKGWDPSPHCLCRNKKEPIPEVRKTGRWPIPTTA